MAPGGGCHRVLGNLECFSTLRDSIYMSLQVGDANYWGQHSGCIRVAYPGVGCGLTLPLIMSADIVTPQRGNTWIPDGLMG